MKNRQMQFWRIVFTYVIAYYHLNNAYGRYTSWYIAVEFFFILSGYLLANKMMLLRENGILKGFPAWKYTWERYKKFFPHCLYSFLVAFLLHGVYQNYGIRDWVREFLYHIPEIFLVQMSGLNYGEAFLFNGVTWYLSALLIVGYFIWFLLRRWGKKYVELVCPLSILIIYPYLFRTYGEIGEHAETIGVLLNSGILRAIADMNLGILGYCLVRTNKIKSGRITEVVSDLCFIIGGILMPFHYYESAYDYLFTFLIFIGIVTGFSCNDLFINDKENTIINKWALITPAIYLNHKVFRGVFVILWPQINIWIYIGWFIFITTYSIFTYWMVNKVVAGIREIYEKIDFSNN